MQTSASARKGAAWSEKQFIDLLFEENDELREQRVCVHVVWCVAVTISSSHRLLFDGWKSDLLKVWEKQRWKTWTSGLLSTSCRPAGYVILVERCVS